MNIKEFFKKDKFAAHTGVELLEIGKGTAKAKLDVQPFHLNGVNTIQGGAIFTLADLTFAAAANSHGIVSMSLNSTISFLNSVNTGTLYATAKEINLHHKIGFYRIDIVNEKGLLIASFEGTAYRKDMELPLNEHPDL